MVGGTWVAAFSFAKATENMALEQMQSTVQLSVSMRGIALESSEIDAADKGGHMAPPLQIICYL